MDFNNHKSKLIELYNLYLSEQIEEEKKTEIKLQFNKVYLQLINASIKENRFFSGSPQDVFKIFIDKEIEGRKLKIIDFSEVNYLKDMYNILDDSLKYDRYHIRDSSGKDKIHPYFYIPLLDADNYTLYLNTSRKKKEYVIQLLYLRGIDIIIERSEFGNGNNRVYFNENIERKIKYQLEQEEKSKKQQNYHLNIEHTIDWKGTPTELMELIKALIENGTIKGIQKDIVKSFANFFNTEINNPDKLIQDIKMRNNGSETLFLDKVKSSLFNYLTKEKRR